MLAWLLGRGCGDDDRAGAESGAVVAPGGAKQEASGEADTPEQDGDKQATEAAAEDTGLLRFVLTADSRKGVVRCAVFDREGYKEHEYLDSDVVPARRDASVCEFTGLAPGEYVLLAFHDQNNNEELERTSIGFPDEPWATSGKASLLFGKPSFDSLKFSYDGGDLTIRRSLD